MKRIIKGSSSRLFSVAKVFLLVSSCFMVSNLWAMESDENRTKDGYYTAELINKTGSKVMVIVYFHKNRINLESTVEFIYNIKNNDKKKIRVKNPEGKIAILQVYLARKGGGGSDMYFNARNTEDIKVGKIYEVTAAEKWVSELKEVK